MPDQILLIEPYSELKFKVDLAGMFEHGYTTTMRLTNPSKSTILFKIKTTAPKKYCVRPNSGVLEPYEKVDIAITPQTVHLDGAEKHKHKFMVQSVVAPEGRTNIDQVFKETNPSQLMDHKLKCIFETPLDSNLNNSGDNAGQSDSNKKRVAVAHEKQSTTTKEAVSGFVHDDKVKDVDDEKTLTPHKTGDFAKSENVDNDLHKVNSEVNQLRENESKLRHENLQLKEELLRLRQSRDGGKQLSPHVYAPNKNQNAIMPWLAIAVAMAFAGIIIGKYFM